jgi:signal peptide peptidase-like 2B
MPVLTMKSLWLFALSLSGVVSILQTMQLEVYLGGVAGDESGTRASPTYTILASEAFFGPHPKMTNAMNPIQTLALPPKQNPLLCKASQTAEFQAYDRETLILVPRGGCSFETKAYNAQQLGATSVAVFGTLSSRYSINTTSRDRDHNYAKSDIVFPSEFQDFDCSNGRAEIPEGVLSFTPLPYNGIENDPLLMGNTSSNLCLSRSTDSLLHCTSLACLLTGRRIVSNISVVPETMLEACCAWDFHIWLSGDGNSSLTSDSNRSALISAVYLTMNQGNRLLQDLTRYSVIQVVLSARWRPAFDLSSVLIWALGVTVAAVAAYVSAHGYRYKNLQLRKRQQQVSNSRRQELTGPSSFPEPSSSEDSLELTVAHAIGFVFVASAALLVLFYARVYAVVKVLYAIGCSTAISQVVLDPLILRAMRLLGARNRIVVKSMLDFEDVSFRDLLAHSLGFSIGVIWLFISFSVAHPDEVPFYWITQDVFGTAMCVIFLQTIKVNSLKVATILLSAAFLYDIFFVFVSPILFTKSVMITVATSGGPPKADPSWCEKYPGDRDCLGGNPLPMLFTIPRIFDYQGGSSLLGLGDIVIPGLLLSFAARHDAATFLLRSTGRVHERSYTVACAEARLCGACFRGYFVGALCAYAAGLSMANVAVYVMKMGQPALLYIVPCCLGTIHYQSWRRQELHDLWKGPAAFHKADMMLSGLRRAASSADAGADGDCLGPSSVNDEDEFNTSNASGDRVLLL